MKGKNSSVCGTTKENIVLILRNRCWQSNKIRFRFPRKSHKIDVVCFTQHIFIIFSLFHFEFWCRSRFSFLTHNQHFILWGGTFIRKFFKRFSSVLIFDSLLFCLEELIQFNELLKLFIFKASRKVSGFWYMN
jgi:hypothetical protein